MADITVSTDIDTLLSSLDNSAARSNLGLGTAATTASTAYATSAQGVLAGTAQQPPVEGPFVDGDKTNLDANTAKVTYPSADSTKLSGIATGAEVNTINTALAGEPTGSDLVLNAVSLTQAEYDAGTPVATTFYIING
jgi:hypothetical protein|tara:strand:+ start:179 stop:592 length:414 start_codon:yes stop_codon:yes gene_type:complete